MIEIKNKFIYELNSLKKYAGMIPLNTYASLIYFNYNDEDEYCKNTLLSMGELLCFFTECIVEILISDITIDASKFNPEIKDFYISAIPDFNSEEVKKVLLFEFLNKKIIVSECKINMHDSTVKMKNISKENLLSTVFSVQRLATCLLQDITRKFHSSKELRVVEMNKKEDIKNAEHEDDDKEEIADKFDKSNYVQL